MVNEIISSIINYTDYLRNFLSLQVSFCNIANYFEKYMHLLYPFNSHYNKYCMCLKSDVKTREVCIQKQFKVLEKSENGAFYGKCWAGVEEYVFPVKNGEKAIGFISISGYRGQIKDAEKRVLEIAKQYGFDKEGLQRKYDSLQTTVPTMDYLNTIISPLCLMFEMLYKETPERSQTPNDDSLYAKILNYLIYNYTKNISLDDIADAMHYSKTYIRQLFKEKNDLSIHQYLTMLRIKRAKELLLNSNRSINKISYDVGYSDPNYFSNVFKKETGLRPKEYRKLQGTVYHPAKP